MFNLERLIQAQETDYPIALREISTGKKQTHWIWYIFPQIVGLGHSDTAKYYAIENRAEAEAYIAHQMLGPRLIEISRALLAVEDRSAFAILGSPDDVKVRSCMTLFAELPRADKIFGEVLEKYYEGKKDEKTIQLLRYTQRQDFIFRRL